MDPQERKVIRWKRDLLAANINMDEATIKKLRARDLIWDSVISEIEESEIKNCEKVWKYLENLMRAKLDKNAFDALCEFLDEENPWISSELREELRLERGQLKLDEYIRSEASTLVHRHFGGTKKYSETEKKQFEDLLATRNQCTKNIWIKNVEQTRQALNTQLALARDRDSALRNVTSRMQMFLNENSYSFYQKRDGSECESPLERCSTSRWDDDESSKSLIRKMETTVDKLMDYVTTCQQSYDIIRDEKIRAIELLESLQEDRTKYLALGQRTGSQQAQQHHPQPQSQQQLLNGTMRMDKEVRKWIQTFVDKLEEANRGILEAERKLEEMKQQQVENDEKYEREIKERDQSIRFLANSLEKSHQEIETKDHELAALKLHIKKLTDKCTEMEEKVRYWEKYRHYGYWFDRYDGAQMSRSYKDLREADAAGKKLLGARGKKDPSFKRSVTKTFKTKEKISPVTPPLNLI